MTCPVTGLDRISAASIKPLLRPAPTIGSQVVLYDQSTIWTTDHLTPIQLNEWRYLGDPVIDRFFDKYGEQFQDNEDTYIFLENLSRAEPNHRCDESCRDACVINFPKDIRQRPAWFDKALIERGQQFFRKYSPITTTSTFSYTLILGYGFQQLNEVLVKTEYLISPDLTETYHRLLETMQMIVHAVQGDIDQFDQTFLDVVRVRLLHGMVRYRFKKYNQQVPINQEDSLITLLGFSFAVLYCMEERMGIPISEEDKLACLHFWRYIGWVIGVKDEFLTYFSSYRLARVISESIFYHFYHPSSLSKHLVHHSIMSWYSYTPIPMSFKFYLGISQILIGEQFAKALDIDQPKMDLMHRALLRFVFRIFRFHHWLVNLNIPALNRWIISRNKQRSFELIEKHLRNFALFKSYQSNSIIPERKSRKDCSCGYYQKNHRGFIKTNDTGPFKVSVFVLLQPVFFTLAVLLKIP